MPVNDRMTPHGNFALFELIAAHLWALAYPFRQGSCAKGSVYRGHVLPVTFK
jgi:hypothetical protein